MPTARQPEKSRAEQAVGEQHQPRRFSRRDQSDLLHQPQGRDIEQQAQQLRESQRRVVELQEKIEALAGIERSLKARAAGEPRGAPAP